MRVWRAQVTHSVSLAPCPMESKVVTNWPSTALVDGIPRRAIRIYQDPAEQCIRTRTLNLGIDRKSAGSDIFNRSVG